MTAAEIIAALAAAATEAPEVVALVDKWIHESEDSPMAAVNAARETASAEVDAIEAAVDAAQKP